MFLGKYVFLRTLHTIYTLHGQMINKAAKPMFDILNQNIACMWKQRAHQIHVSEVFKLWSFPCCKLAVAFLFPEKTLNFGIDCNWYHFQRSAKMEVQEPLHKAR